MEADLMKIQILLEILNQFDKAAAAIALVSVGKLDKKAVAAALHGLSLKADKNPGVIMDVAFDEKGDIKNGAITMYETKYKEALALAKRLGDGLERSDAYRSGQYRAAPLPQNNGVA